MSGTKEKIIQFGEGGFLRSFVDVFIHKMNEQGLYEKRSFREIAIFKDGVTL